jgi:ketosteroid isomerase-like protein
LGPDARTEAEGIGVLARFRAAVAARDTAGVLGSFAPDPDVLVVTSEQPLLRGHEELVAFVGGYAEGPTTYSWESRSCEVSAAGTAAWLLAQGT